MIKKIVIDNLSSWLQKYGDSPIELQIEVLDKKTDIRKIVESPDFEKQMKDICHWIQYFFLIRLEKEKPFFVSIGDDKYKIKIDKAFNIYT